MPNAASPRKLSIALHAAQDAAVALCGAMDMPAGEAPDWIHLLPAGDIRTGDGRGPYRVVDAAGLVAASLQQNDRLVIDENHATDLAAPKGGPAPARGWIVGLEARQDGIWGKVEWTAEGKALVAGRSYRGVSPVIIHTRDNTITAIARASLVNRPNLKGLTSLHSETDMNLLEKLRKALGLDDAASEDAILTAVTALHQAEADKATALQAQLAPIAKAAGLKDDAKAEEIIGAITAGKTAPGADATVTALQSELTTVTKNFNTLRDQVAKDKATAFVDGAIKAGRVGVKPLRDHYIAMHAQDPERVEKEIGALPILGPSGALPTPPVDKDGKPGLTGEQTSVIAMMGISEADYRKTLEAEGQTAAVL